MDVREGCAENGSSEVGYIARQKERDRFEESREEKSW